MTKLCSLILTTTLLGVAVNGQTHPAKNSAVHSGATAVERKTLIAKPESASAALALAGSLTHVVSGGGWETTMTLVNNGSQSSEALLKFFNQNGSTADLPFTFLQQFSDPLIASDVDQLIDPGAELLIDTQQYSSFYTQIASAQLLSRGGIDGFSLFTYTYSGQIAATPIETRSAGSYFIPFDNTNGVTTGIALASVSIVNGGGIPVTIRDDTGATVGTDILLLGQNDQTSFVLSSQYASTSGIRGTIEFDPPAGTQISVLGLRFAPIPSPGIFALSAIPTFANTTAGSGSFAQMASGGGWQTTLTLVNLGSTSAQAQLAFYDNQGNAQTLPFTFPQTNDSTAGSSLTETLAPGATLVISTNDPNGLDVGSAQFTTTGQIAAFATLRYNPTGQETEVPLETRNAASYVLAFENGGLTGVALANVSPQPANIPVVIRSDGGFVTGTSTISLTANGHISFLLGDSQVGLPTGNLTRGTIEFQTPAGGQISAVNIRSIYTGAFTTIPVLAKASTTTATVTTTNILANDLVWDPTHQEIYLSLPSIDGPTGNSVQALDPLTGELGTSAFAGSEPNILSVSATGKYLYVGLNGSPNVQRMTLPDLGTDIAIALGNDVNYGPLTAGDLEASPVADGTVAIAKSNPSFGVGGGGEVIYDDTTPRANVLCVNFQTGCTGTQSLPFSSIQWNADGTAIFASSQAYDLLLAPVTEAGFGTPIDYPGLSSGQHIHFDPTTKLVYSDNGNVFDPLTGIKIGVFGASGLMAPDGALGVAFFLSQPSNVGGTNYVLQSFDINKFTPIATLTLTNIVGTPTHLIRWGTNGLAFTSSTSFYTTPTNGAVYIISGSFVNPNSPPAVAPTTTSKNIQRTPN